MQSIINKQRPPGDLPAGAAVFRGTLFFLPYFAAYPTMLQIELMASPDIATFWSRTA